MPDGLVMITTTTLSIFIVIVVSFLSVVTIVRCNCSEDLESKYANKLTREMSGPEYEIISRIMKTLVNKKITVPGSFVGLIYYVVFAHDGCPESIWSIITP